MSTIMPSARIEVLQGGDPAPAAKPLPPPRRRIERPLKKLLGGVGTGPHDKWRDEVLEQRNFFLGQCVPYWNSTVRYMKLYLAKRDEKADRRDDWMPNIAVPLPLTVVETKTGILSEIITSADPIVQAEGVDDQDYTTQRPIENLLSYTFRKNRIGKFYSMLRRMCAIQGTELFNIVWVNDVVEVALAPDEGLAQDFVKRLQDATAVAGMKPEQIPDFLEDPEGFGKWRELYNMSDYGRTSPVPLPPTNGQKVLIRYRGPKFEPLSLYDVCLDPLIGELQEQPRIFRRLVKPNSWIEQKAKEGIYDAAAVAEAIKAGGDIKRSTQEKDVDSFLGLSGNEQDPSLKECSELTEVWTPGAEVEYAVLLNRKAVINPDLSNPYQHKRIPFGMIRNLLITGRAFGLSELQAPEGLFEEMSLLRNLRLARTILETFPSFLKLRELGMPELAEKLVPGGFIQSSRPDGIKPLFDYKATNAFQDMGLIERNIADASGVYGNVRGSDAEVNRVSATESSSREARALTRIKLQAVCDQEELNPIVEQLLFLWWQKGDSDLRIRVGGADPFVKVAKEQILESLEQDYEFRGATRAIHKDIRIQQLNDFLTNHGQIALIPPEYRATLRMLAETLGVKGLNKVLSAEGERYFQEKYQMSIQQMQFARQEMVRKQIEASLPPAPSKVPLETGRQLEGEVSGAESAPAPAGAGAAPGPGGPSGPPQSAQ